MGRGEGRTADKRSAILDASGPQLLNMRFLLSFGPVWARGEGGTADKRSIILDAQAPSFSK
jgi:hypothetical protein